MTQPKNSIDAVVFDLGGVLVDWNPRYLYRKLFQGDESRMETFLTEICNDDWNRQNDGGRSFEEGSRELIQRYPEYESYIRVYFERFEEMLGPPFQENVEILGSLKNRGIRTFALTNWSAETFAIAERIFPFFSWFEGVVVSGRVKLLKPDPAIYHHLIDTHQIAPTRSVFIDDRAENTEAAEKLGFKTVHLTNPAHLREKLIQLELPLYP